MEEESTKETENHKSVESDVITTKERELQGEESSGQLRRCVKVVTPGEGQKGPRRLG